MDPSHQRHQIVERFDQLAEQYNDRYEAHTVLGHAFRTSLQRVCEVFDQAGGQVLDVGCGSGVLSHWLRERGCQVYGIDISRNMIRVCQQRFEDSDQRRLVVGTLDDLPFQSHSFDAVICKGVLDHVESDEGAVEEVARVAKSGARIIISVQQFSSPYRLWNQHVASFRNKNYVPARAYQPQTLSSLLQAHHLRVEDVVCCNGQVFVKPLDRFFPGPAIWAAQRLERFVRTPLLSWLATDIVVKARRI